MKCTPVGCRTTVHPSTTLVPEAGPTCAPAEAGRAAAVTVARITAAAARTRTLPRSAPGVGAKRPGLWTRPRNRVLAHRAPFRAELRRRANNSENLSQAARDGSRCCNGGLETFLTSAGSDGPLQIVAGRARKWTVSNGETGSPSAMISSSPERESFRSGGRTAPRCLTREPHRPPIEA